MSCTQDEIDSKNPLTFESWDDEDLDLKTELLREGSILVMTNIKIQFMKKKKLLQKKCPS